MASTETENSAVKKIAHDLPSDENGNAENGNDQLSATNPNVALDGEAKPSTTTIRKTADVKIDELNVDFKSFMLKEAILKGLKRAGFVRPSPIQLKAIPIGRVGFDMIVQAKSGLGKTCVFTTLALEMVEPTNPAPQVIILAPAREIAVQIHDTLKSIGHYMLDVKGNEFTGVQEKKDGIKIELFIGGTTLHTDQGTAKSKKCQIIVGTPGRIWQLVNEGFLSLDAVRLFVLDEADKLMEESYHQDINSIYAHLPAGKQILVTSATYPRQLDEFLSRYMTTPKFVKLDAKDVQLLGVKQYLLTTEIRNEDGTSMKSRDDFDSWLDKKIEAIIRLLSRVRIGQCLIFCNHQDKAEILAQKLAIQKWPASFISSSLDQAQRLNVFRRLKEGQIRILVSTDLTARGIDAENVNMVINFDLPFDAETYFHRIGRAGRFGGYGAAITMTFNNPEEIRFMIMAEKNNFHVKRLPAINEVPDNLAENEKYFVSLPPMEYPLEKMARFVDKQERFDKGRSGQQRTTMQRRGDQQQSFTIKTAPVLDEYTKLISLAGPIERWSPVEFLQEEKHIRTDVTRSTGAAIGERRSYTRETMLEILKENLSSLPSSRASAETVHSNERDLSPSPTIPEAPEESMVKGERIDVNSLFGNSPSDSSTEPPQPPASDDRPPPPPASSPTTSAAAADQGRRPDIYDRYLHGPLPTPSTEPPRKPIVPPTTYSRDQLFGIMKKSEAMMHKKKPSVAPGSSCRDTPNGSGVSSIHHYDRDEMLKIRPLGDRSLAESLFDMAMLKYTFKKKKSKKVEQPKTYSRDEMLAVRAQDDRVISVCGSFESAKLQETFDVDKKQQEQVGPSSSGTKPTATTDKRQQRNYQKSKSSVATRKPEPKKEDIREQYDEAIRQAANSPFYQFFGGCTLKLQASAAEARKPAASARSVDASVQTDPIATMPTTSEAVTTSMSTRPGWKPIAYSHDEMVAVWRSVAEPSWSYKRRSYPWLPVVIESELLVDRKFGEEEYGGGTGESAYGFNEETGGGVAYGEVVWKMGDRLEDDDDADDEEEGSVSEDEDEEAKREMRELMVDYKESLKEHRQMMKLYKKYLNKLI